MLTLQNIRSLVDLTEETFMQVNPTLQVHQGMQQ